MVLKEQLAPTEPKETMGTVALKVRLVLLVRVVSLVIAVLMETRDQKVLLDHLASQAPRDSMVLTDRLEKQANLVSWPQLAFKERRVPQERLAFVEPPVLMAPLVLMDHLVQTVSLVQ